jgi:hypothetical protein
MENECKKHGFWRVTGSIIGGVFIAAAFALVVGALVMVLWNWLMPAIFGLTTIGYWQGFGLVLIAKLLFGGVGHMGMGPGGHKGPKNEWRGRYEARDGRRAEWKSWRGYGHWYGPNGRFDEVYEDWWKKEGSAGFEAFMKQRESDKKEPDNNGKTGGDKDEQA